MAAALSARTTPHGTDEGTVHRIQGRFRPWSRSGKCVWIGPVRTTFDYSLQWGDKKEGDNWEDYEKRRRQSPKAARARLPEKYYVPEKEAPKLEERLRKEGSLGIAVYRVYNGSILLTGLQVTP